MDRGAWCATVHGVAKSPLWLSDSACTQIFFFFFCELPSLGSSACISDNAECAMWLQRQAHELGTTTEYQYQATAQDHSWNYWKIYRI